MKSKFINKYKYIIKPLGVNVIGTYYQPDSNSYYVRLITELKFQMLEL